METIWNGSFLLPDLLQVETNFSWSQKTTSQEFEYHVENHLFYPIFYSHYTADSFVTSLIPLWSLYNKKYIVTGFSLVPSSVNPDFVHAGNGLCCQSWLSSEKSCSLSCSLGFPHSLGSILLSQSCLSQICISPHVWTQAEIIGNTDLTPPKSPSPCLCPSEQKLQGSWFLLC